MSFEPREYLRHILAEADYLVEHSRHVSKAELLGDETLRRAFVKSLEIIGQAAKKIPDDSADGTRRSSGARWQACAIGSSAATLASITTSCGT
jgi:uncharacterized protein with HEPN domain